MNTHLTDEQITRTLLSVESDAEVRQHLADCQKCGEEVERMRNAINGFRALVHEEAGQRQLRPVSPAKTHAASQRSTRFVWTAAVVLLAVAVLLLRWTPVPQPPQSASSQPAEDTLLLEIQQDLNREVPEALAPALVLTAERNRILGQERASQNR
jgi:anti-sigma factor RsiW